MPVPRLNNEKAIQQRISEGDEKAFTLLFNHYYPLLRPLVAGYALTDQDREEILQETFVRVWMHRDALSDIQQMDKWIFRVASRECLNMLRKNVRARKRLCLIQEDTVPFYEANPVEKLCLSELSQLIQEAVDRLPPRRKLIYQMSRSEGMRPAEIAEKLSLSVSTVKNVLCVSLRNIREYLTASGVPLLLISLCFFGI